MLLHPLDILGQDDLDVLSFFPAMDLPRENKVGVVKRALQMLTKDFSVGTLEQHASKLAQDTNIAVANSNVFETQ